MEMIPLLPDITAVFCLSILVLLVCHRFHVPPIVGFLLTGVLSGPSVLGLVDKVHNIELMSEIGIILLLFTIGMELSGAELRRLRKPVFIGGLTQVLLTILFFTLMSFAFNHSMAEGIIYGFLAALSSTAIVLSLLQQSSKAESPQGRLALAILIFQDMAIVPMMLAIPLLAGHTTLSPNNLLISLTTTMLILGGGWLLAKFIVPRLMAQVMRTRNKQLLLMTTLVLCFAVAIGTASLGLSLALGAFLAGLLLAESEYSLSAVEGVLPFKDVFTSLFFIAVGMLLDIQFFIANMDKVFLLAAILIIVKVLITIPAVILIGYPLRVAILVSMILAQIGEFSFVLAKSAFDAQLMDQESYQLFLAASIITMSLTPVMFTLAPRLANAVKGHSEKSPSPQAAIPPELQGHLIIVGFGVGGKYLAYTARKANIPYIILEMNPETINRYKDTEPIHYGDASYLSTLEYFGVHTARVLAVVISDPAAVRSITAQVRRLNKKIHIVVRTRFIGEIEALCALGANDVIPEDFETSIEIFSRVLGHYLVPRQSIETFITHFRCKHYTNARQLSVYGSPLINMNAIAGNLEMLVFTIEEGAAICCQSLIDIDLRGNYGITIIAIQRGDEVITPPSGDEVLLVNDIVFIFGTPEVLSKAEALFQKQQIAQ